MTASSLWIPYCGAAPLPAELLARWNMDPFLFAFLTTLAALALPRTRGWPSRRRVTLSAAFALIVFLYVSPFCALASALFSARVAHHLLLVLAAAPLLATTIPEERLPGTRSLAAWTAVQAAIFWLWHAPPAYSAALSHDAVFWQMQATLLASAAGFWAALRSAPAPAAAAALLATTVQMGVLGALITFAGAPLYAPHKLVTLPWRMTQMEDQQLAGLIMWAPASAAYLIAALWLVGRWFAGREPAAAAR